MATEQRTMTKKQRAMVTERRNDAEKVCSDDHRASKESKK